MRMILSLLLLLPGILLAESPTEPPDAAMAAVSAPEPVVMARVADEDITVEDFMQYLRDHPERVKEATTVPGKAGLLRNAIENLLFVQAMVDESLLAKDAPPADRAQAYAQLVDKHFPLPPIPDEAAAHHFYLEHQADFGIPASVRLTQIQFRADNPEDPAALSAAKERAEAAMRRLEAGESFSALATELTENPRAKQNNGDVGYVVRYGDPWLDNALKDVAKGEHTGILESPVGFDILMITDESDAIITPFAEAKELAAQRLREQMQEKARQEYLLDRAKATRIEIMQDDMKEALADDPLIASGSAR